MMLEKNKEWEYGPLQDAWCDLVDIDRPSAFYFYDTKPTKGQRWWVVAPDISSVEPVARGNIKLMICDADESQGTIRNPKWKDIANFFAANYANCPLLRRIELIGKILKLYTSS
jgi:hypothetical protein